MEGEIILSCGDMFTKNAMKNVNMLLITHYYTISRVINNIPT